MQVAFLEGVTLTNAVVVESVLGLGVFSVASTLMASCVSAR